MLCYVAENRDFFRETQLIVLFLVTEKGYPLKLLSSFFNRGCLTSFRINQIGHLSSKTVSISTITFLPARSTYGQWSELDIGQSQCMNGPLTATEWSLASSVHTA